MSSRGVAVDTLAKRPPLRTASCCSAAEYSSKARVYCVARLVVELQPDLRVGLGIDQLEFAVPWRSAVLLGVNLNQQQFVPEIGQVLQRLQTIAVVQEIGENDYQSALLVWTE